MNTNAATIHPAPAEWAPAIDPRNADYPAAAIVTPGNRRKVMWELPVLNQGANGACVGYAIASAAGDPAAAERIYAIARSLDRWAGDDYTGTSVTAGARAAKALGVIASYRWAFTAGEVLDALCNVGPVVLGLYWTPGMLRPAAGMSMSVDAPKYRSIGHCAVAVGYDPLDNEICIQSSWGTAWGTNGRAWLPVADLEALMGRTGEACVVEPA